MNILVVEDNLLSRRLVQVALQTRGHTIVEAGSVDEARSALAGRRFDIVLLDVQIPGGGGERLLSELRRDPERAGLPILAVTALAMRGDRERLLAAGFDGYISKPIDIRSFGREVESFVVPRS